MKMATAQRQGVRQCVAAQAVLAARMVRRAAGVKRTRWGRQPQRREGGGGGRQWQARRQAARAGAGSVARMSNRQPSRPPATPPSPNTVCFATMLMLASGMAGEWQNLAGNACYARPPYSHATAAHMERNDNVAMSPSQ